MTESGTTRRPTAEQVEAHFQDDAGSRPVARDFDSPPGALCGNGLRFYDTVRARKPPPDGWTPPPQPGSDPRFQGPSPLAPFKESPYAMPAPRIELPRRPVVDRAEPAFSQALRRCLAEGFGPVAVAAGRDAAEVFPFIAGRPVAFDSALLDGSDEVAAARALLAEGIEFVLIDRTDPPVAPWLEERMDSLQLRLRDAGDLSWFHPRVLGSGWAFYRVAPPLVLAADVKRALSARVRDLLAGRRPRPLAVEAPLDAVGQPQHRVVVSLRMRGEPALKGRKLAKRLGRNADLVAALDRATAKLRQGWAAMRAAAAEDYGLTLPEKPDSALDRLEIEIEVFHDLCRLTDRTPASLGWDLQIGLEGLYLWDEQEQAGHYLEPAHAVHRAIASPVVFLETALRKNGLTQFLRPAQNPAVRRERPLVLWEQAWRDDSRFSVMRFRALHWIEQPGGADIVELYRGVPLHRTVTRESLVTALQLGAEWLMTNQTADGQYAYKYTPVNKPGRRWTAGGNIVRHALNPYTLLLVNAIAPDARLVASARRGIDFTLSFLRWEGNRCVICHRDPPARFYNAKLGTNAVTILSILKLAEVGDIGAYEPVLLGLAEELLALQDPNGHFWQYDVPPEHPYYGAENPIAPGEFILALARMHKRYQDPRYQDSIERALAYYLVSWRAWRLERTSDGIYDEEHRVNLVGIVPWLVMAMKDLHDSTGERRYADIAFEMQDWLDGEFFYTPQRSRYADWLGGAFKVHSELPAVNSCQYIEGASAAFALAKRLDHDVARRREVVVLGARFCLQLQYDGYGSTFFLPEPAEALGGFRYTVSHLHLRNDYSYHAMAALAQAVSYLDGDDYLLAAPSLAGLAEGG